MLKIFNLTNCIFRPTLTIKTVEKRWIQLIFREILQMSELDEQLDWWYGKGEGSWIIPSFWIKQMS